MLPCDMIKAVQGYLDLLTHLDDGWDMLYEAIGDANKEQQDLLHEIELTSFNAFEGFVLCKKLKDLRVQRRVMKNEQEVLNPFKEFMTNNGNKNAKIALHKTLTRMKMALEAQDNKVYHPRIRTDLKLIEMQKRKQEKSA